MRFYNQQHKFYCGIYLHARKMYVCIINAQGKTKLHQNLDTDPVLLFDAIYTLKISSLALNACLPGTGLPIFVTNT